MPVYLFSIVLGLGAALGLLWAGWQSQEKHALQTVNAGLFALLGSLLGGRVAYIAAHWSYFQNHRGEMAQIYLGGIAWPGALAGGVLAVVIYSTIVHQPSGQLLDALLPLLGLVAISAWLGCWLDGCAYGQVSQAWWALPARNEWGVMARRVPVQLLGALLILAILGLADRIRWRLLIPGQLALLVLSGLTAILFWLSFLRADSAPSWKVMHLESWAALALAISFLLAFIAVTLRERQRRPDVNQILQ